jgi:hypothetical protein
MPAASDSPGLMGVVMATRAKGRASRQESVAEMPLLKRLLAYKEVIVLVLFILGGAAWIYNTFATKCFLEASLESNSSLMTWQGKLNELAAKRLEIETLENLQAAVELKGPQLQHLNDLRNQFRDLAQQKPYDPNITKAAFEKCTIF